MHTENRYKVSLCSSLAQAIFLKRLRNRNEYGIIIRSFRGKYHNFSLSHHYYKMF